MSDCFSRDFLVQSGSYSETMNEVVLPWLESQAKAEEVPGAGNCPLYSIRYDAAEPAILWRTSGSSPAGIAL